jgi:YidC/Oxa1 family membrane protein insertase
MSQQQQPPGKSIFNAIFFAAFIFLGYQLFFGQKQQQDPRSRTEILESMRKNNQDLDDVTIFRSFTAYQAAIKKSVKEEAITEEDADTLEMEAAVLVADTQYKSGLYRQQKGIDNWAYQKMTRAHQGMKPRFEKRDRYNGLWDKPYQVSAAPDLELGYTEISPGQLYDRMVEELKEASKGEKVIGLISGYWLMDWLVNLTGAVPGFSYWFAGLLLAILVRVIIWPLAHKQYMWGRKMAQLAPYTKEIKEKFTDKKTGKVTDPQGQQQETMKLYAEYGINPLSGCGPALIQMPLFLLVYQCMLLYKFEFTAGTFLWMHPGQANHLGFLQLAPNLGERDHVLVIIYMITMIAATLVQPVSDPTNKRNQRLMGVGIAVVFSVMMFFWPIPSAFVVYWVFTNILTSLQSMIAYRMPLPPLEKVQTGAGGKVPFGAGPVIDAQGAKQQNVNPDFFGSTGTPKRIKKKKKSR